MDTTQTAPKSRIADTDPGVNGKVSKFSRFAGYVKDQSVLAAKTLGHVAVAPVYGTRDVCKQMWADSKTMVENPLSTAVAGSVFGVVGLQLVGAAPILILGLSARCAMLADNVLAGIAAGAVGFLVGTAIAVYLYELAIAYALFEAFALAASQAARIQASVPSPAPISA